MLKSAEKRFVINDYIENDPLSEINLDKTLELVNEIRLSLPEKSIWLYTGYTWEEIFTTKHMKKEENAFLLSNKRAGIVSKCDVLVDGRYIDSQHDITLPWCGSANQRIWKKTKEGEWFIHQ